MRFVLALIAILAVGGCGPLVMIPGGALSGTVEPVPDDWSFTDEVDTVQLETRPDDPYSVNIWGVGIGERFYVAAGDAGSAWAGHLQADPRVRLRVGESIYELTAVPVRDEPEREAFLAGVKQKYDFEPDDEQRANSLLFRLDPR